MDSDKRNGASGAGLLARNLAAYETYQSLFFQQNGKKTEQPEVWREEEGIQVEEAKNKSKIFSIPFSGTKLYFNSRYSPQEEAVFYIQNFYRPDLEVVFFIGMGFGYRVKELLKVMRQEQRLILVEPDPKIFRAAMKHVELSSIFSDARVRVYLYEEETCCRQFIEEALGKEQLSFSKGRILTLVPPSYSHVYRAEVEEIKRSIGYTLKHIQSLRNTILSFSELWLTNYLKNIRFFACSLELEALFGKFSQIPAYLISSGPSLRKNIKELKKAEGRGILLTGYTALKVLLENGIQPDFVVALDGKQLNYETEEMLRETFEIPLIYSPFVDNRLLEKHQGIKIRCTVSYDHYSQYLDKRLGRLPCPLYAAGTVAATMLDIAFQMGCRPIVFAGQDLAYTDNFTHVPGTSYDAFLQKHSYDIRKHSFLLVKDVFGGEVKTDYVFLQYKKGLEDYIRFKPERGLFLDATEGGVRIEGTELSALADVVKMESPAQMPDLKQLLGEERIKKENSSRKFWKFACQDVSDSIQRLGELAGSLEKITEKLRKILSKEKNDLLPYELEQGEAQLEKFCEDSVLFELAVLGKMFSAEKESEAMETECWNKEEGDLAQTLHFYEKIISLYQNARSVWEEENKTDIENSVMMYPDLNEKN